MTGRAGEGTEDSMSGGFFLLLNGLNGTLQLDPNQRQPFHDGHHRVSSSDPLPLSETFSGIKSSTVRCPLLLHRVAEGGGDSDIASPPKIQTVPLPKTVTLVHFLHHRFVVGQHHCTKLTKIIQVGNQSSKSRIQGGDAGREVRLGGKESL